jgi:hypothetical protein
LLAVLSALVAISLLVVGAAAYRARRAREAAQLAAEQERSRENARLKTELEAKMAAIQRQMDLEMRKHPPGPSRSALEERQRLLEDSLRRAKAARSRSGL